MWVIETASDTGRPIVFVGGQVTPDSAVAIVEALRRASGRGRPDLLLEMSKVGAVVPEALDILAPFLDELRASGFDVAIDGASAAVRDRLQGQRGPDRRASEPR